MRRLWAFINRPFAGFGIPLLDALLCSATVLAANYAFIYSAITGRMLGRRSGWEGIEGRAGFPAGYWFYLTVLGIAVIAMDVWILRVLRNLWRNRSRK